MDSDWFPDPSGRFARRYFDGSHWTDHVVGANGTTVADPLVGAFPPPPPPMPTLPPPPAQVHPGSAAPAPGKKALSWAGVSMAGVGVLLAALSLYALDWADGATAGDVRDGLPDPLPDGLPFADVVSFTYVRWGGLLFLLGAAIALIAVALAISRRDGSAVRVLGAVVVGTAAILHTVAVVRLFRGPGADPAFGAWLGTVGFLTVALGLAIATPNRRTAS